MPIAYIEGQTSMLILSTGSKAVYSPRMLCSRCQPRIYIAVLINGADQVWQNRR